MKHTPTTQKTINFRSRTFLIAIAMFLAVLGPVSMMQTAKADQYDDRIRAMQAQIAGYQEQAAQLAQQQATLQQALDSLTAQKNTIQAQLDLSQAQLDKIKADIETNEKKLATQQGVLTSTIADLTSESQVSPIQVLAGSSSVGDFVMRQDQLNSVQDQLQNSIKEIIRIKQELAQQKADQEQVVADQTSQRNTLAQKEAEQAQLVAATQNQEAAYQNLIGQTSAAIAKQRADQAAANARASYGNLVSGGSSCGGYPALWCNSPQDSLVDNWGMYNRECVSYVAWKIAATGHHMPYWGGHGNANQWPSSAAADGIATGSTPRVGAAAILMSGWYGHAMYVERINNDGTVHVSQFNWLVNGQWGRYSEMDISSYGLIYIYF